MGYKIGDRVRSLGIYPEDSADHVPRGALGTVVGRGGLFAVRVRFGGRLDFVHPSEIEPAETRTERIVRRVRETGRPFIGRYRNKTLAGDGGWALIWPDDPDVVVVAVEASTLHSVARQLAGGRAGGPRIYGWLPLRHVEFIG